MSSIPASAIVNVVPGVISAGGSGLNLIGLFLTESTRIPIGTVQSFASVAAVTAFFGAGDAAKTALASAYFSGNTNASLVPAALLGAQCPLGAVAAYLRGGNISALTLTALQALNGTLGITIDGSLKTASINLSAATSFSNAAEIIANGLSIQGVQAATFTGSMGSTTLTVSALASGTIGVGDVVQGTGVIVGTYILAQLTGSAGGTGTYSISTSQTAISAAMTAFTPAVQFDSVSGAFTINSATTGSGSTITFGSGALATSLLLTQVTGAVLSQGAGATTPIAFMNALILNTQNWATFFTAFNPDAVGSINTGSNTNKLAFAQWASQQNNRYAYLCWDNDASPTVSVPASASLGALIAAAGWSGTSLWYDPNNEFLVAAVSGSVAQLNFNQANGRATIAFDTYAGLVATVTNQQVAANLIANGYNFYGAYATANAGFVFAYSGSISGPFLWLDSFVNQIWMNSQFQLALMQLLAAINSIPYNAAGNSIIEQALATPIQAAINFGAIRSGVVLSSSQIIEINTQANANVAGTVSNQGWYLQILPAAPAVRAARTSPPITFWYCDGGSVQQINMQSLDVQ